MTLAAAALRSDRGLAARTAVDEQRMKPEALLRLTAHRAHAVVAYLPRVDVDHVLAAGAHRASTRALREARNAFPAPDRVDTAG
jgi:hypothetical protein